MDTKKKSKPQKNEEQNILTEDSSGFRVLTNTETYKHFISIKDEMEKLYYIDDPDFDESL